MHRAEMIEQELRALIVVGVGQARLGDVDRQPQARDPLQGAVEAVGVDLAVGVAVASFVALWHVFGCEAARKEALRQAWVEGDVVAGVVVQAEEVAGAEQARHHFEAVAERDRQASGGDGLQQQAVEQPIEHHGRADIVQGGRGGVEQAQVVDDANLSVRLHVVNGSCGGGVPTQHGGHNAECVRHAGHAGRPQAHEVALHGVDQRLVDGASERAVLAEVLDGALYEVGEALRCLGVQPAAALFEPAGIGEVVQGDHRGKAPLLAGLK